MPQVGYVQNEPIEGEIFYQNGRAKDELLKKEHKRNYSALLGD